MRVPAIRLKKKSGHNLLSHCLTTYLGHLFRPKNTLLTWHQRENHLMPAMNSCTHPTLALDGNRLRLRIYRSCAEKVGNAFLFRKQRENFTVYLEVNRTVSFLIILKKRLSRHPVQYSLVRSVKRSAKKSSMACPFFHSRFSLSWRNFSTTL